MNYGRLWSVAETTRNRQRFSPADRRFVVEEIPARFSHFPDLGAPERVRHSAGFSVSGASVRTLLRSALLLAARGAMGSDYHRKSAFYASVETDLALRISLSLFRQGDPKGAYCCPKCTLAVLPLYRCRAIHWFDCRELEASVRALIEKRAWRFSSHLDARMLEWSLK